MTTIPTAQKEQAVQDLFELVSRSKGAILTDYRGLTVAEITDLRKRLRETESVFHVVKNTLFKRALQEWQEPGALSGRPDCDRVRAEGSGGADEGGLDFIREKRKASVKAGWIDGRLYNEEQADRAFEAAAPRVPHRPGSGRDPGADLGPGRGAAGHHLELCLHAAGDCG